MLGFLATAFFFSVLFLSVSAFWMLARSKEVNLKISDLRKCFWK